ncbi:hypothetical protein BCR33DRAFT_469003 [Rhizoclosmatium globosum]|uniref:Uncharacterized protein n=1 Tax=Rhizoclosmatium globosum TaxID=329046 RepID=A0A1Y2BQN3_9FUNG|nr:hypothetical protein BCR33DRAFT_469003 [Rhizoclosmatium globosum]|eukprot:ORY37048.1 hypothetical protein BCR33DRAFT_469003 [Rhizoclosmatium globosum]
MRSLRNQRRFNGQLHCHWRERDWMSGANNQNFAMADGTKGSADQYWGWAKNYAMSDRFYQSAPGASSQGEMYFARGAFVFKDNNDYPANSQALGTAKACTSNCASFQDPTIGDLLQGCNVDMKFYHVGFQSTFDPTDDAFLYYPSLANGPNALKIFVPFTQLARYFSWNSSSRFIREGCLWIFWPN